MNKWCSSMALLLLSTMGCAEEVNPITGLFFNTVSHGERFVVTTRVPNHPQIYPQAGMQILTPGFALADPANECSSYNARTKMCIFPVGNTAPKVLTIQSTAQGPLSSHVQVKLCLDGVGQLTCQHYTHKTNQFSTVQRAYVVTSSQNSAGQGYVSVCELLNEGATFGVCRESASSVLVSPQAMTFNASGDMAYITDFGNGAVANCAMDPVTGLLAACHSNPTGIPTPSTIPPDPSRHSILGAAAVGTSYVYVPYFDDNSLQIWSLKANGSFKTMTTFSDASFHGPNSATLSPNGQWVYVANTTGNNISACHVSGATLTSPCGSYSGAVGSFENPLSVSFNAEGNRIYIAYVSATNTSAVAVCAVDSVTGVITLPCTDTSGNFNFGTFAEGPAANIFMQSGLNYGYVPNANTTPGEVSICQFNLVDGTFTSCTTNTSTRAQFITPTGVALNPVAGT